MLMSSSLRRCLAVRVFPCPFGVSKQMQAERRTSFSTLVKVLETLQRERNGQYFERCMYFLL